MFTVINIKKRWNFLFTITVTSPFQSPTFFRYFVPNLAFVLCSNFWIWPRRSEPKISALWLHGFRRRSYRIAFIHSFIQSFMFSFYTIFDYICSYHYNCCFLIRNGQCAYIIITTNILHPSTDIYLYLQPTYLFYKSDYVSPSSSQFPPVDCQTFLFDIVLNRTLK